MKKLLLLLSVLLVACQTVPGGEDALAPTVADVLEAQVITASGPSEFPFNRKPRPSTFVPANPDTRTPLQWAQAACQAASWSSNDLQRGWRCGTKVPRPMLASGGSTQPIIPTSWTVPNWFVNKSTGNDANSCTSSGSPCATKQEIFVHRWGCNGTPSQCPRFQQVTTLTQQASDTDNTDPGYLSPAVEQAGSFTVKGGLTCTAAVFTRSAQKNRNAGANSLLAGSFSAGSPAAGMLVQNTTASKSSNAWIYTSAGGSNWNLSQPIVPQTVPGAPTFTEIDTWATNDTVNLCTPVNVNLIDVNCAISEFNGAFTNGCFLYQLNVFDPPQGTGFDNLQVGGNFFFEEVSSTRFVNFNAVGSSTSQGPRMMVNSFFTGGAGGVGVGSNGADPAFHAGVLGTSAGQVGVWNSPIYAGTDIIFGTTQIMTADFETVNPGGANGSIYLDGNLFQAAGTLRTHSGTSVVYGSANGNIILNGSAHLWKEQSDTFQSAYTLVNVLDGGFTLNAGHTAASSCVGVIHAGIPATPLALDTTCGTTGFGGAAYNWAGASVANF